MKFHHIGFVVKNIDEYLLYSINSKIYKKTYDPIQHSNLALIYLGKNNFIELIEPIDKRSTTYNFLKNRGGGFHHICYNIKDELSLKKITSSKKIKIFWGPKPAILFNNKNVLFGMSQNNEIIEFILDG